MQIETLVDQIAHASRSFREALLTEQAQPALELRRSARLPVIAALQRELNQTILLLTDRGDRALILFDELSIWAPHAPRLLFPEPNSLYYERGAWGTATRRDRLNALTMLASYHLPGSKKPAQAPILVASARALMTRTIPRRDFLKAMRVLRPGQEIRPEDFTRTLVELGYQPVNTVIAPGQFARRGGLLDVWPLADDLPTRIEFFGDELDTLRRFDPTTQRSTGAHTRLVVSPAREFILPQAKRQKLVETGLIGAEYDLPGEEATATEFLIPYLHPTPASLLDYLTPSSIIAIDNLTIVRDTVSEIETQSLSLQKDAVQTGLLPPDPPLPYLTWTELLDTMPKYTILELGPPDGFDEEAAKGSTIEGSDPGQQAQALASRFTPGPRFGGRLKPFIDHLEALINKGEHGVIISRQSARLEELWEDHIRLIPDDNGGLPHPPTFLQGSLGEGWIFKGVQNGRYHVYTDGEIFGWRRPEPRQRLRKRAAIAPESPYADLQAGDYVVHVDHGVGCFIGLVNRTIDGIEREYLSIEYADEAQLFVPVHQADRITRYVGPNGRTPNLSRLGSNEWRSAKSHVKEAVQEVAEELLELYARRNVVQGYAFGEDTPWQQELEASFPYIETEDQIRVLEEVKSDMQSDRPMDRLVCGDVGYGKTEVALRAAFKAVMDGKQVAILVPTTVLAQQHFQTFRQRISAFPMVVEMLSRFRTPQEQREIVRRISQGSVDIVIGTHRLLSQDVKFKDLGLLIIDEEQRFGVTHKERLKQIRTEVDVLTMTATPIPRTLYMTLTGVRDISTINTPPEERLPIITHVGPYSPRLVRQAILRELERGGQVFFVHNRVQTINAMRAHLEKLVPEARLTVAHGQMAERELSGHMDLFTQGKIDVLICTSIIESGLDIPNANTLIVDRADTFGLAQLYQLRGRVGRGAQRAYAYFFRHTKRLPTREGRQRLETIAENTQLGAGLSIAMRDLEIRGAGDLLGTRQHGHIAAVGFHLYTRLLGSAINHIRRTGELPLAKTESPLSAEIAVPVNVDLPLPANIPAAYVPDKNMRLRLYRRLADIHSEAELQALVEEFEDRFGPIPEPVENLLFQLRVRLAAEKANLASISVENNQFVLRFPEDELPEGLPSLGPEVRAGKTALWMPARLNEEWRPRLMELLERLRFLEPMTYSKERQAISSSAGS